MVVSVCPAAVVAAPVECVWELLAEPRHYDAWWEARTVRIVPEGPATPGQMLYGKAGRLFNLTLRVEAVRPERHQIALHVTLPFGIVDDATITCTPVDAASCRVQFG